MFVSSSFHVYSQNVSKELTDEAFEACQVSRPVPGGEGDAGEGQVGFELFNQRAGTAQQQVVAEVTIDGIGQPAKESSKASEDLWPVFEFG